MRVLGFGMGVLWVGVSWVGANWYFGERLRKEGRWVVWGAGPLWDSTWTARHIEAHGEAGRGWNLWALWVDLWEQQLFERQEVWLGARLTYHLEVLTRTPVAALRLPGRLVYIDREARLLPHTRPLNLPILEMPRWDSRAARFFLTWWQEDTLFYRLSSHLYQDGRGVWYAYAQVFPETFILGRTEDLPQARRQWYYYSTLVRPRFGASTCKFVLLYVPDQIICQKS